MVGTKSPSQRLNDIRGSSSKNTFKMLWEYILKNFSPTKKMLNTEFEDNRLNIACYNQMNILDTLFVNAFVMPNIMFQMCRKQHTEFVCEDMKTQYLQKIINASDRHRTIYFIQRISFHCTKKDGSHTIMLVLSPHDRTISFIDPVSSKVSSKDDLFFKKLHTIYECLDKVVLTSELGNKYTIACPQLHSDNDIQTLLTVDNSRNGACTVFAILIPHVMIYTKENGLDAINSIAGVIKNSSIKDIHSFADGYVSFLSTIIDHPLPQKSIYNKMDKATLDQFDTEKQYVELINKLRSDGKISWVQHRILSKKYMEVSVKGYSKWYRTRQK
jgi:hypothetical protein